MSLPNVEAGCLYALRLFEVAQSIDLATLTRLPLPPAVHVRPGRLTFFGQLRSLLSVVHVGPRDIEIEPGEWVQAECDVLLFAFGVAVACFQMPIVPVGARRGSSAASAADLAEWVARLNQNNTITTVGREIVDWLLGMTKEALDRPRHDPMHETYTIVSVQRFTAPCSIDDVLASNDVVRILLGESPEFTPAASFHQQIVSHPYRYGSDDLCIVDWDAAFIVDPKPNEDLIDLLALALTELLEFQRFDMQLEQELKTLYDWTNELAPQWPWASRARRRVDMVNRLLIDIGEFVDRSGNAFKITEDVYYARVYRGAIERFQVPAWRSSVLARQRAVSEIARTLYDRTQLGVAHSLELIIIGLIAFEIVMALLKK
jgi:hypothetical protein